MEAGPYESIAGSDADNDFIICDPGEACGALLTVDQPIVIDVQNDRENLDFPIEYLVALPDISSTATGKSTASAAKVLPKAARTRMIGDK